MLFNYAAEGQNEQITVRVHSRGMHASMLIYTSSKRKFLHKKRVKFPQGCLGTPKWPPFHCFGTPKCRRDVM